MFDGEKKGIPILTVIGTLNDDYDGGEIYFVNQNLKQWKQEKLSTKSKRTVGGLAAQFIT